MKRALVTGGSGAIGAAICRRLAADDSLQVIVMRQSQSVCSRCAGCRTASRRHRLSAICFDVADAAGTASALATLLESGPISSGQQRRHS